MTPSPRWTLAAVAVAALLVGFVVTRVAADDRGPGERRQQVVSAGEVPGDGARTALPGLAPATGEPTLPGFDTARPAAGAVARVAGPFDDRYTWSGLRLGDGRVSGDLTVTSDVSDLLELEVVVGFYDARGDLLGTRRAVRHHTLHQDRAGAPDETQHVVVGVPGGLRGAVVAAAVGVPVLVNE
ncbi:hypothetical protein H5V45_20755 [Nocardioides sp. KIGAM211]|uniref:Uncharacterized protein n=1 Tax=Nocardioides luti TaxID=2761101 RepID=A0A7X0VCR0_9ACTN|nr:hypothetical protein [Nocardioides luti]MBB6629760.1 hypothetical protein [Nocardioides luti]